MRSVALAVTVLVAAVTAAGEPANLLLNGSLDEVDADRGLPVGWTTKHPKNVRSADDDARPGPVIIMNGGRGLMGTYGADLLSRPIRFKPNHRYRLSGWSRSDGPNLIVFIKGYAAVTRRVDGEDRTADEPVYQMKKEIEPTAKWTRFEMTFTVTPARLFSDFQHEVKYLRVLLWAYWPPGDCAYDDIRFEEIGPLADAAAQPKRAVTHTGERAQLAPVEPTRFDVEQAWIDAANAWRDGEYARCWVRLEPLLTHVPDDERARLLAARVLIELDQPQPAAAHIDWLLAAPAEADDPAGHAPSVADWRRDFAVILRARLFANTGRTTDARALLTNLLAGDPIAPVRREAESTLEQITGSP